jgi:DNA-binding NarL/FixJ family response regulator
MTDAEVVDAVRFNVGGIVLKESASRTLVQCVRTVAGGERWLDQQTIHGALESMLRREAGLAKASKMLTKREMEIVRMVATGLRNKQIADQLNITEGTVKMHLHSIYDKLKVTGRVELSNYARENDLA